MCLCEHGKDEVHLMAQSQLHKDVGMWAAEDSGLQAPVNYFLILLIVVVGPPLAFRVA